MGSRPVQNTLEELENGGFFLRLGLPSTRIRHKNGRAFRKRSLKRRNLKSPALRLGVDRSFENDEVTILKIMIVPCPTFTQIIVLVYTTQAE